MFSREIEFTLMNSFLGFAHIGILLLLIYLLVFVAPSLFKKWIYTNKDWSERISKYIKTRFWY